MAELSVGAYTVIITIFLPDILISTFKSLSFIYSQFFVCFSYFCFMANDTLAIDLFSFGTSLYIWIKPCFSLILKHVFLVYLEHIHLHYFLLETSLCLEDMNCTYHVPIIICCFLYLCCFLFRLSEFWGSVFGLKTIYRFFSDEWLAHCLIPI